MYGILVHCILLCISYVKWHDRNEENITIETTRVKLSSDFKWIVERKRVRTVSTCGQRTLFNSFRRIGDSILINVICDVNAVANIVSRSP